MKGLDFYKCSFSDFSRPFRNDEVLYKQARDFWNQLDSAVWLCFGFMLVAGVGFAIYYYTAFNNQSGRHYKPNFWWLFMLLLFLLVLVVTLGLELLIAPPRLEGAFLVEMKVAAINAIYSLFLFVITSFVWCNSPLPTNAYRYLKLSK